MTSLCTRLKGALANAPTKELRGHQQKVLTVGWSSDGRRLGSGSADKTARVYTNIERTNSKDALELKAHTGDVDQLCWDPTHPDRLATASLDSSIIMWDVRTADRSKTSPYICKVKTTGENINLCWSPDGRNIAVGNKEDVVAFIDPRGGGDATSEKKYIWHTIKNDVEINEISWNFAGDLFFMTTGQGTVRILEFPGFKQVTDLYAHTANLYCLDFDPRGKYFATGSADALVALWDLDSLLCLRTFGTLEWPVRTISMSHDGELIASGSEDRIIDISSVETGHNIYTIHTSAATNSIAWHPYKHLLAYAGDDAMATRPEGNLRVFGLSDLKNG
ncbi:WD40-repeat-containing domain protein [Fimicolochytrium jonesii]|uniref:WD40-repeat-containing domain protein n=1 Tax=Fimicolochytrium jonesii TaxID=1396493 RepID=UPI0022FE3E58|nr:WD40-repeat-containing domain protein [Fimicolochytrium jonesii]KAI8820465.1 WD40-repeat-containing domain protein [Fimicolochytrium jonesii]